MIELRPFKIIRRTVVDTTLHIHATSRAEALRLAREHVTYPISIWSPPSVGAVDTDDDVILRETYRYGDRHD